MTDTSPPAWYSTDEAAEDLGISQRTVYNLINTGQLTGRRIGRVIRIRREDLDDYLQRAVIDPGDLDHLIPPTPRSTKPDGL